MMEYEQRDRELNFIPYLAGRAFLDPEFRERLLSDPEEAATSVGLHLSPNQIEKLGSLNAEVIEDWVAQFHEYTGQTVMAMSAW